MRGDSDKFNPDVTQDQMVEALQKVELERNGFHIGFEDRFLFPYLLKRLSPGSLFPLQIASGPLLSMRGNLMYAPSPELKELMDSKRIELFIHLPFVINPYKEPSFNSYVTSYLTKLGTIYPNGNVSYVLHCSYPGQIEHAYTNFKNNLVRWQSLSKNRILLENLAGSSSHKEDYCSPMVLYDHFLDPMGDFYCNNGKLGLCVDTEHAWAQGIDGSKLFSFLVDHRNDVGLIHWNSAPKSANFGKHVDMHSYTTFRLSLERRHMWSRQEEGSLDCYNYDEFLNLVRKINYPTIFERAHLSIQIADLPDFVL